MYKKLFLLLTLGACISSTFYAQSPSKGGREIQWTSMTDALAKSEKSKKKILVDFYTDWCGWCKVMDAKTYTDPKIIDLINKYFIPVKFNAEKEGPIMYKGQQYSLQEQGMRSTHTLAIKLLEGQMGYPTTTFLNLDHSKIQNVPGYIDANEMNYMLRYFGENKHLSMQYDEFKRKALSSNP